jgi:hypothetical protein
MIVWLRGGRSNLEQIKATLIAVATLLSGDKRVRSIEVGFFNTANVRYTIGGKGIGLWRVRLDRIAMERVLEAKMIPWSFWRGVQVLLAAGDNERMGSIPMAFDEFEARA